ncbi:hypothetical protein L9F63_002307, partial [Diploptera punctata]
CVSRSIPGVEMYRKMKPLGYKTRNKTSGGSRTTEILKLSAYRNVPHILSRWRG